MPLLRQLLFAILALATLNVVLADAQTPALLDPGASLVLTGLTVVDIRTGALHTSQTVVIDHDHIVAVSAAGSAKLTTKAERVDCTGLFAIPGLWDMHVHLSFGDWFPGAKEILLPLFIANGITGVRDMGSDLDVVQSWRSDINAGRLVGPRIFTSGPMLDGPKPRFPNSVAIATPDDARRGVADLKHHGADFIKLQSLIPREAVFAIADEAKKQHIPFEGHVPDSVRASEMSAAGMKSFEHLIGIFEGSSPAEDDFLKGNKTESRLLATFDGAHARSLASLLAQNQTWQCPTLVWERGGNLLDITDLSKDTRAKYVPASWKNTTWKRFTDEITQGYGNDDLTIRKKFLAKELEIVHLLHEKGVPFLAGTDTPPGVYIFPGFSLHEELQRFVSAGFTPLEALQTATLNPARFFNLEDQFGAIEPGKLADIVLLHANPIEDISNTQKIAAVISNGHYFSRQALDKLFTQVESSAKNAPTPRH